MEVCVRTEAIINLKTCQGIILREGLLDEGGRAVVAAVQNIRSFVETWLESKGKEEGFDRRVEA